ncbi:MAG: hypothetical protein DME61_01510, partial [Verrucomicrobia bacterium]
LVDATPWKQQVALAIGVVAGAFVIPPVLDLVNHAYGFVGAPGAEARPNPLPAPQAGLISSLAKGVIAADIDWSLIQTGALIGVGIILLDEILARTTHHMRVPPLAVGLGIYLPTQSTLMIVVGAIVGWFFDQRANRTPKPEATKQLGVLLASGLIVGEGIIGVVLSAIVVFSGKAAPLAVVGHETKMESADLGWFCRRRRRIVFLRLLRAVSNHPRFSMGKSITLWNWRCVVDRRPLSRFWPAATLSRQNLRLNLYCDRAVSFRIFQLRNLLRPPPGSALISGDARWGKGAGIHVGRSKWKISRPRGFAFRLKSCRADFLSRLLVNALQLRVAEFSATAFGFRCARDPHSRHQHRSA